MYDDDCYHSPDLWDTCPVEYITESAAYADDDADLDGWDEDGDEDEEG